MRPKTVLIAILVILAVAAFATAGAAPPARQATPDPGADAGFVGAWRVTFVIDDTPVGINLTSFLSDGIVLASNLPSLPTGTDDPAALLLQGTSHGAWEPSGDNSIDITFVTLHSDVAGNHVDTRTIRGTLELDPSGDAWNGVYTATVTDPAGEVVRISEGSVEATRIVVEPMEPLGTPAG